ncbi:hypothetical protein Zmor_008816 [Zophobas morio]|uniref:Cullin family profile domain-containing protein n=1 Tax=Zophobas morio TaxID=2755281 RepID=A0AA38HIK5_9CUCU|nr:hypothetical protein Zmor_008816 [Zophobas morio]
MEMCEDVYRACVSCPSHSAELYSCVQQYLITHLYDISEEIVKGNLLKSYYQKWKVYQRGAYCLDHAFYYFNMLCLEKWRIHIFDLYKAQLVCLILAEIESDRNGNFVDPSPVKGAIDSFVYLNPPLSAPLLLYQQAFEAPFLEVTSQYYSKEAALFASERDFTAYMIKALKRIEEEEARVRKFVDLSSYSKVLEECERQWITNQLASFEVEIKNYLRKGDDEALSVLYSLIKRVPPLVEPVSSRMLNYLSEEGLVRGSPGHSDPVTPVDYVDFLFSMRSNYLALCRTAFENNAYFIAAVDKAFRVVINATNGERHLSKSPELLAFYCDAFLKKSSRNPVNYDIDEKLNKMVTLFEYLDEKDVFLKFYSRLLAKRLINSTSSSLEAETQMISSLKQTCGNDYTAKLESMLTDIGTSEKLSVAFRKYLCDHRENTFDNFRIVVLGRASWPIAAQQPFPQPPSVLKQVLLAFEKFYVSQHSGRKLQWLPYLSKCELRMNYLPRRYEVQCSFYQMSILLLFNYKDTVSIEEGALLDNTLATLINAKILAWSGTPAQVVLNKRFSRARGGGKFKLPASIGETENQKDASKATIDAVITDRQISLQATIMRIMKTRRKIAHRQLLSEVASQTSLRFKPAIAMIKKCIESLIDQQYLARAADFTDCYEYIS